MKKAYVFLATGFEEIEAITPLDLLKRAGIDAKFISTTGKLDVSGSHGVSYIADDLFENLDLTDGDIFVLPGGQPGTNNLNAHEKLKDLIVKMYNQDKLIAAICAAPLILGGLGLLKGKDATIYPGLEDKLVGANVCNKALCVTKNIITARSLAAAIDFSLAIIEKTNDKKESIRSEIVL